MAWQKQIWIFQINMTDNEKKEQLLKMVQEIVPSQMKHHAESEACDLLMEVERLDLLDAHVDTNSFGRVCLYLTRYKYFQFKQM